MYSLMPALSIMPADSEGYAHVDFRIYDRGEEPTKVLSTLYHVTYYSKGDIRSVHARQVLPTMVRLLQELVERVDLAAQNPSVEGIVEYENEDGTVS
jgi:hypothetical protein